jgi:shikimate dehydrogenase
VKKILGLLGSQIEHSLSPLIHNTAIDELKLPFFYGLFDIHSADFLERAIDGIRALGIVGVNVTAPFKERAVKFLDSLSAEAAEVQAVNTILNQDGTLIGYNTDIYGFSQPLLKYRERLEGETVAVLGSGGAARAVIHALKTTFKPHEILIVARNEQKAETLKDDFKRRSPSLKLTVCNIADDEIHARLAGSALIINATPVGSVVQPDLSDLFPDDAKIFSTRQIFYDLNYAPRETALMANAKLAGVPNIISGVEMLLHQAAKSFELWTGQTMPIETIRVQGLGIRD